MRVMWFRQKLEERLGPNAIIRALVAAAALVLSWYLAQSPSTSHLLFLALAAAAALLFRYQLLGLLAIIVSAMVIPFAIGTGTQSSLNLAFLAVPALWGLELLVRIYHRRPMPTISRRLMLPLLGLILAAGLSFISGYLPWNPFVQQLAPLRAQIGALGIFAFSVGACLLVAVQCPNSSWLKAMTLVFLVLGGVYVASRALSFAPGIRLFMGGASGSMFWVWMIALAGGQLLFNQSLAGRYKVLLTALLGLLFFVALGPDARDWLSGWLPAFFALAVLVILRWPRLAPAFAVVLVVGAGLNYRPLMELILTESNEYSLLTRVAAFEIVTKVIQANPLLGVGPANYYYYTPLFPILGWHVRFNSHNQYVDLVAQAGLAGLFFYLWFFVEFWRLGWTIRDSFPARGFEQGYVYACLAGLVGMAVAGMLGDWVLPFVYNVGVNGFRASVFAWLFVGGLAALGRISREAQNPQQDSVAVGQV